MATPDFMKATVVAIGFGLAACQGTTQNGVGPAYTGDPLAQIATFTVTDLQTADAEAVAQGDAVAHACYPALEQFVQGLQGQIGKVTGGVGTPKGAFSAFQAARGIRLNVQSQFGKIGSFQVPTYLKLGCSPLVLDEQTFLLKLAALAGAGAATAGVAPAIGGILPAIGGALPIPITP